MSDMASKFLNIWFVAIIVTLWFLFVDEVENIKLREDIPTYLEAGYAVYMDGENIDPNTIDFDQHEVSVDTERKGIYLTRK